MLRPIFAYFFIGALVLSRSVLIRAARDADAIRRRVANFGNAAGTSTGARRMGSERSMDDRKNIDALVDAFTVCALFVHVNGAPLILVR